VKFIPSLREQVSVRQGNQSGYKKLAICLTALALGCVWNAAVSRADEALANRGESLFSKECARCHQVGIEAKNKVGPHLDLIIGRTAGTVENFRYSKALKKAGEGGLDWDESSLDQYIEKPRTFIKGNRMSYRGMSKPEDRKALLAWLKSISEAKPSQNLEVSASASAGQAPGFADEILKIEGDTEYGEYLSGDCVTCHQISGQVSGIPSIVGVPMDYFVRALVEYKTNVRTNEVMKNRVVNLSNEEIAALAAYFGGLEPQ
jgi:cytochrome c